MSPDKDNIPQEQFLQKGLGFFGAITASVTHELNNVLGTIDQISGLLEDLAFTSEQGEPISGDQLNDISGRINKQTERGIALVKRFNRFAHATDHPLAEFNMYDGLENLLALMKRLARMRKIELSLTKPIEEIIVRTNPFSLLEIIFLAIGRLLPFTKQDTLIEMSLSKQDNDAVITVLAIHDGSLTELPDEGGHLELLISHLSGKAEERFDEEHYNFELRVPISGADGKKSD